MSIRARKINRLVLIAFLAASAYALAMALLPGDDSVGLIPWDKAKHFIVVSPVKVPKGRQWGVRQDAATKDRFNIRQHAYVVIPMDRGFYVIIYPATRDGFTIFEKQYNQVLNSFEPLTDGPAGAPAPPVR